MADFALPRVPIPARLRLTHGQERTGHLFVMARVPQHTGTETPLELLNRPEGFFPFRDDGEVLLVTKAHTISVLVDSGTVPEDPARASAAKRVKLELVLAAGLSLTGWAPAELPAHHARLLDYLNESTGSFFALRTADGIHYVNRAHVLYARPQD
jgi:hypothetical protein